MPFSQDPAQYVYAITSDNQPAMNFVSCSDEAALVDRILKKP